MTNITKAAGAYCPKCKSMPAEFKMATEKVARWRCSCGAEGEIASTKAAAVTPVKKVFPHWGAKRVTP